MIWNVVYTISMGKHGNQRVPTLFEGTEEEVIEWTQKGFKSSSLVVPKARKGFPVDNILLIEWSEVKK